MYPYRKDSEGVKAKDESLQRAGGGCEPVGFPLRIRRPGVSVLNLLRIRAGV